MRRFSRPASSPSSSLSPIPDPPSVPGSRTARRGGVLARHAPAGASARLAALVGGAVLAFAAPARADVSVIQPATVVAASEPLRITLLFAEDDTARATRRYTVPPTLSVTIASGDVPPTTLTLRRAAGAPSALRLRPGEFRRVSYTGEWPAQVRGALRLQVADFNAAPALVTLDRGARQEQTVAHNQAAQAVGPAVTQANAGSAGGSGGPAGGASTPSSAAPGASAAIPASDASIGATQAATAEVAPESRLSFYEPMYIGVGGNGHTTARFQLSFKYRVVTPADPRSRGFLDNLYFGYTQASIWDLTADSKPFRDTSYKPSLFYYLPDIGVRSRWFDSLGVQAGLEHESNGKSGTTSRSINLAYVEPIVHFNTPYATQLTIAPKIYYYLQKDENRDIIAYRGYTDLQIRYGRPDGLELFTTLRKGNHGFNGSVDAQLTYPMQKLVGGAFGGYLWVGYFNGYGESLLDYNNRLHWNVRVGYSIFR